MVFTRSQKRNIDEVEVNSNSNSNGNSNNYDVNQNYTNLNIRVNKKHNNINNNVNENNQIDNNSSDDSYVTELDSYESIESTDTTSEKSNNTSYSDDSQKLLLVDEDNIIYNNKNNQIVLNVNNNKSEKVDNNNNENSENSEETDDDITYKKFMNYIDKIYSGDFFQRIPPEDKMSTLKKEFTVSNIQNMNSKLNFLQQTYKNNAPSVIDILQMNVHDSVKSKLLEKVYHFNNSDILSNEYNSNMKYLMTNINKTQDPELYKLEQEIIKHAQSDEYSDDYRKKILKSGMQFNNKVIAYKRLDVMERYEESDSSEYAKYKNWMDILLSIPFGNYIKLPSNDNYNFIKDVRETLDKRLSFLEKPKDQIINIVTQMIRNPDFTINAIGLWGNKGLGKTAICKSIAEALGRPFKVISLGGESDSSILSGHNFTYVGSAPGRLIEILNECKCMNPVILFDEIDKVSQTHQGKEIIGNLIHLTDKTTNEKYNYDRYFSGIEFDLSKVLFVFTYNDPEKVDRILADRLYKIKVDNYTLSEKLEITNLHLINNILEEYSFSQNDIHFDSKAIEYVVNGCKSDEGMRDIKRKFEIIISRINTLLLTNGQENIIKLKYKKLQDVYKELPVKVLKEHIDIFLENSISSDVDFKEPPIGMYI